MQPHAGLHYITKGPFASGAVSGRLGLSCRRGWCLQKLRRQQQGERPAPVVSADDRLTLQVVLKRLLLAGAFAYIDQLPLITDTPLKLGPSLRNPARKCFV